MDSRRPVWQPDRLRPWDVLEGWQCVCARQGPGMAGSQVSGEAVGAGGAMESHGCVWWVRQSTSWQRRLVLQSGEPADHPGVPGLLGRHGGPAPSTQPVGSQHHSSLGLTMAPPRYQPIFQESTLRLPETHGGWVAGTH